jgi:hypothetical protein
LPIVEHTYNKSLTTVTSPLPFYANYGLNPRTNWLADAEARNLDSQNNKNWVATIHDHCHIEIEKTRDNMERYYNKNKKNPLVYAVGDDVQFNRKDLKTRRLSKKLDHKLYRPFQVEKVISLMALRLTLLQSWGIYNVFYIKILELYQVTAHRPTPDPAQV